MSDRPAYRRRAPARALRRRPTTYSSASSSRPDRVAAWAFVLGVFLILVAATSSHGYTGGAVAPSPPEQQLGDRVLGEGSSGAGVRTLQLILSAKGYGPLDATGLFDGATTQAVQSFQRDTGLPVDGLVVPQIRRALLGLMNVRTATWYGPGLYGNRTACGGRLGRSTLGVAHRSLPCGTPVTFYHRGRFVTVKVIDRGPYTRGVSWDLTAAAAQRLGVRTTTRVRSLQ